MSPSVRSRVRRLNGPASTKPIDIGPHRLALQAREAVRALAELAERRLAGLPGRAGVLVETGRHPGQLVDRPAEALSILLREFRPLGGHDASEKPECGGQSARDTRQVGLLR